MPKEHRKRGKRQKKSEATPEEKPPLSDTPSWIVKVQDNHVLDLNAPFGYVEADVKSYFRTVDAQIRDWQETGTASGPPGGHVSNEDRQLFFVAALNEMSGKERQLATDPECSVILERMVCSMDDFSRRVFMDRLSGSYEILFKHRFASHVCQTLLASGGETVTRECCGKSSLPSSASESGELRTLVQLVLDLCQEIAPSFSTLALDPFASHVVRELLTLLDPMLSTLSQTNSRNPSAIRSKKSASYKAKQGPLKSVFSAAEISTPSSRLAPEEFKARAKGFVVTMGEAHNGNEIRALAASQVASPVLQLLLEIEASHNLADSPNSLMDHVLVGLITDLHSDLAFVPSASDYVSTLFRDPTSSHLLETIISHSPEKTFEVLWDIYLRGKLARLAVHPVANFVVARALARLDASRTAEAHQELSTVSGKLLASSRIGVFRAAVDRASTSKANENGVLELVYDAFGLQSVEDRIYMVPGILRLLPLCEYKNIVKDGTNNNHSSAEIPGDILKPKIQGALLLQSLLNLPFPHNQAIFDSLFSLSIGDLIALSHDATSSRVLDVLLESPTVPHKVKLQFVLKFLGHYHLLVDDRIGSRVGDRCWEFADPYLKEKIARSLLPHEQSLIASFYGKFFAKNLNLSLLRRDARQWQNFQVSKKAHLQSGQSDGALQPPIQNLKLQVTTVGPSQNRPHKRKNPPKDEIEQLFDTALGSSIRRTEQAISADVVDDSPGLERLNRQGMPQHMRDKSLEDVIGAIKSAPRSDGNSRKKRKK